MTSDLRDALEQLVRDRESNRGAGPSDYVIAPYEITELLAAHPAEPVGVSNEAVAVDAHAYIVGMEHAGCANPRHADIDCPQVGATPVASRDRIAVALHDRHCPDRRCEPTMMGAYYDQADALLAAGVFRELPSREMLSEALLAALLALADTNPDASPDERCRAQADAVLALMGGA